MYHIGEKVTSMLQLILGALKPSSNSRISSQFCHQAQTMTMEHLLLQTESKTQTSSSFTCLVVGLGNHPFPKTRHSVGMMAIDKLAQQFDLTQWEKLPGRKGGFLTQTMITASLRQKELREDGNPVSKVEKTANVFLFKPKSLMNICGCNVAKTAKLLNVDVDHIYLIHDELDLSLGKGGMKFGGSANGHRGVLSCISSLKAEGLWTDDPEKILRRLRIGIGRPPSKSGVVSHVLGSFTEDESFCVNAGIEKGLDLLIMDIQERVRTESEKKT